MSDLTLGDRMKQYESNYKDILEPQTYVIIRLDGKAFHTFTKRFEKPFDINIQSAMWDSMGVLMREIPGARLGYTQSDEVSILVTDFEKPSTQQWYGGSVQKMVSVSASIMTLWFNRYIGDSWDDLDHEPLRDEAYFDSRVFTLPTKSEVMNYFQWRKNDCNRNAVSAVAQSFYSHRELEGVGTVEKIKMLDEEHYVDYYKDYPLGDRNGMVSYKEPRLETISYTRKDTGETLYEDVTRNVVSIQAVDDGDWFEKCVYSHTPNKPE